MTLSKPYRFFTIIMAMVVLLSSTGFGLVEHSCMMRGKSVAMMAVGDNPKGCHACKPATPSEFRVSSSLQFKAKACCEESQKHQKIEVVSETASAVKVLKGSPLFAALGEYIGSPLRFVDYILPPFLLSSLPPLLLKHYGRTMLLFVQSFLI